MGVVLSLLLETGHIYRDYNEHKRWIEKNVWVAADDLMSGGALSFGYSHGTSCPPQQQPKKDSTWWRHINSAYYRCFLSHSLHFSSFRSILSTVLTEITHSFPQKEETYCFSFQKKSRQQQPGLVGGQMLHLTWAWRTCPLVRQNLPKFPLSPAGSSAGLWFALWRAHSNASFKSFLISHQQLCNFQPSRQSRQITRAGEVLWAQGHWRERNAFYWDGNGILSLFGVLVLDQVYTGSRVV